MSIEAGSWAWRQELPSHLKFTLVALAEWADPTGYCWPQVGTIADRVGAGESTVRRHLNELADMGLLDKVKRRRGPEGGLRGWEYQLHLDQTFISEPNLPLTGERKDDEEEGPSAHGRADLALTGERSYEPPVEPPVTPLSAGADEEGMSHAEAFDVLASACGLDAEGIRATGGALIGRNASIIRGLTDDPSEVHARAEEYRRQHPDWDLTPAALVKWWPTLEPSRPSSNTECECGQPLHLHDERAHELLLS